MAYTKNPIMRMGTPPEVDPITGMPVQTTMVPPQMAPMGGGFTPQVQQNIQGMTGTPEMRQYAAGGLNAPLFMKDIPEGDKGAGLRKLPNSVVEQMGYDSATRMVSPLNQKLEIGAKMVGKEIPKKMSKELTDKPRVPVVENTKQAFGITKDGKKVNLGKITSTEIPEKDFKQR